MRPLWRRSARHWRVVIGALAVLAFVVAAGAGMPSAAVAGSSMQGDASCNARTDAIDSSLILQLDAGLVASLPCEAAGDVDYSTVTNSVDSSLILQYIARVIPSLPALVSLHVETAQPVGVGEEFVVEVRIENVEHLAAFDIGLSFDVEAMTPVRWEDLGEIFTTGQRSGMLCFPDPDEPLPEDPTTAGCSTAGLPVCFGGPSGPSGDGTLGRAVFRAERAGTTALRVSQTALVWDDVRPCDPATFDVVAIPNQQQGAQVVIGGG